ncbi:MAG: amidohydrolase family protein [Novosphingobium sp.]|uniref:amidohydrolase family protein n=1 Tax=Novosphingobium sp. TaxID=1874826 RepID=UPI0027330EDA|nr:amidohydrolase family protein [Novosphingobium sp.]MDP3550774.1 amidohydrolase family protein [Novosphingobium sp.]
MTRDAWRNQVGEDAIEPALPIIDAHHHVWENEPFPPFDPYDENGLFADKTASGHRIIGTIYVDSHTSYRTTGPDHLRVVGETDYAERVAQVGMGRGGAFAGVCCAIAPRADLTLGARVGEVLDAHAQASSRFRGVRHMTAHDGDVPASAATGAGVMMHSAFREGFAELGRRGLSFDAWLLQPQLPEVIDLARHFPDTPIILNHLGGPLAIGRFADRRDEAYASWRADMATLATCENVRVKLGGLNMGMAGVDALARDVPFTSQEMAAAQKHFILTAIDLFGPARAMFESNTPIDTYGAGYGVIWNAFKRITADFTPNERALLFCGTATKTYRIDPTQLQ